jgi:protein phosphatase
MAPLLQGALNEQEVPPNLPSLVSEAIKGANQAILQRAQADADCRGMGATVAVVLIRDGKVTIGHVGDCRVYHLGADQLTQITRDQTLVARLVEMGQLTPEDARTHPSRNEVLQAVGRHPEVTPADYELSLKPGEWLVVACDGLHAHVDATTLKNTTQKAETAAPLADRLVEMANQGGGSDNCTVVAVRCH